MDTEFLSKLVPTFEKLALAKDKEHFINNLQEGYQKTILKLIKSPLSSSLKTEMIQAGVPSNFVNQLMKNKLYEKVLAAKSKEEITEELEQIKKMHRVNLNHSRPLEASVEPGANLQMMQAHHTVPSVLQTPSKMIDLLHEKLAAQEKNIQSFTDYAVRSLPAETLMKLNPQFKENVLQRSSIMSTFDDNFITDFIINYLEEMKKKNKLFQLPSYIFISLTSSQLALLSEKLPILFSYQNFNGIWFRSNYEQQYPILTTENKWLTFSEKQEKRKLFEQITKKIQQINNPSLAGLENQILLEMMILDLDIEDPILDRYVYYLQNVRKPFPLLKQDRREKLIVSRRESYPVVNNRIQTENISAVKLTQDYLTALLRKYTYEVLDAALMKYLDEKAYLVKKAKALLNKGEDLGFLENVLSEEEKRKISQTKYITISSKNKKKFSVDEDVYLNIKIKNVRSIKVKIYELNLEKHYLNSFSEIDDTMNLKFLQPSVSFIFESENTNKCKEEIYDIPIKQIKKQRGIYVVDLEGDGLSSRAIIRKGSIFCIKKMTIAGIQLQFYDQLGQKIQKLDLWIRGKKQTVKGSYILPFSEEKENLKIIAIIDNYAELISLNIPPEQYFLDISCIYNQQTFIVGNMAKIILHPRLEIRSFSERYNNEQISLKLMKNIKVRVEIENNLGIKSSINHQNIQWSSQQDYILEFPIQSYIKSISVVVMGQIKKYTGKSQELYYRKNIDIDLREERPMFIDFYLKKVNDNYQILALGKNGEPITNFSVTIDYLLKGLQHPEKSYLKTNNEGKILLGPLKLVNSLAITSSNQISNPMKTWTLFNPKLQVCVLETMTFKEGETVKIPLPDCSYDLENDISVLRKKSDIFLTNVTKNARINGRSLEIADLKEGAYIVKFLSLEYDIKIFIIKGVQWKEPNQIYNPKKEVVYELKRSSNHFLCLGQAKVEQGEKQKKISVQIMKDGIKLSESLKAHILIANFISPSHIDDVLPSQNHQYKDLKSDKFEPKYNSFYSDKKLSEEEAYVLNRKNQKQFIGNNMEKPHIFLNRIKVRDTTQKEEVLQGEKNYMKKEKQNLERMEDEYQIYGDLENRRFNSVALVHTNINAHNNFLSFGGLTLSNIKGDKIEFNLPNNYSYFSIVLMSNNSCLRRNYCVNGDISKKNISHSGIKISSEKDAWTILRQVHPLQEGESIKINRDSRWSPVSLGNIVNFAKIKGISLDEWVISWNNYSWEKKLEVYNKKVCHQLNCYIKNHDSKFFNTVVKPYIKNKIRKTFVDLCLLDSEQCIKWSEITFALQLNDFEKILLIEYLMGKGEAEKAEIIANSLILREKNKKQPFQNYKKQFDTVLTAKVIEDTMNTMKELPKNLPPPPLAMNPLNQISNMRSNNLMGGIPPPPPPGLVPPQAPSSTMSGLFGMMPQPLSNMAQGFGSSMMQAMSHNSVMNALQFENEEKFDEMAEEYMEKRETFQQQFKQVEKTEEYTEVTYSGVKLQQTQRLVQNAQFWSHLAAHLIKKHRSNFLSDSFMFLQDKISFTLASCFLPNQINAQFEIYNEGHNFVITAKSSFMVFVKEIKQVGWTEKFGVMINHRFFDPNDQYQIEDDGLQVQKEVEEFVIHRVYSLQTVVTNTSGTNLELQLLVDLPESSVPLCTKEYTQIITTTIPAFSTRSFNRFFYFPQEGKFNFYTSNACWGNTVISKAKPHEGLVVKSKATVKNLQSLNNVIRSGNQVDILNFLKEKNIFDKNIFNPHQILWMLSDKGVFEKIIRVLKSRGYFHHEIWIFAIHHLDIPIMQQYLNYIKSKSPNKQYIPVFEYYPYYSTRTHKFLNESKTTIRNVEFKQTYFKFLFEGIIRDDMTSSFKLALTYYLLLQDRIDEASDCFSAMTAEDKAEYQLQADYFQCFLDMYQGYPTFTKARKICKEYVEYPIKSWQGLFKEIDNTLNDYDKTTYVEEEENRNVFYVTTVSNEGQVVKINIPPKTEVEVAVFPVNLELYFSEKPFGEIQSLGSIRPSKTIVFQAGEARQEKVVRDANMKDVIVEIYQRGQRIQTSKVSSFLWNNPAIKVKMNENRGNLQIFLGGKQLPGIYCKVYSRGTKGERFYRDGYTDITGTFKYALSDLKEVQQFSILTVTEFGGSINKVKPPSEAGYLDN